MWTTRVIPIEGVMYFCEVKRYETPSRVYGIDGGRISKLHVQKDGVCRAAYERGWNIEPVDQEAQKVVTQLIEEFN